MANIDYLRQKVKYHIKDVYLDDEGIDSVIETVLEDLSTATRLFKKIYGFTVHKEINTYNFRYIARLNEKTEQEPTSITVNRITNDEIQEFITNGGLLPSPKVDKVLEMDLAESRLMDVLDIFDEYGVSIADKFEERGSSYYMVYDQEWLDANDGKTMAFVGWVVPNVDELHEEQLIDIVNTVIAGVKFYVMDSLHSKDDTQATNYDYMRYFQKKEDLVNRYSQVVYSTTDRTRSSKW
jgi:hypothetical protein